MSPFLLSENSVKQINICVCNKCCASICQLNGFCYFIDAVVYALTGVICAYLMVISRVRGHGGWEAIRIRVRFQGGKPSAFVFISMVCTGSHHNSCSFPGWVGSHQHSCSFPGWVEGHQ